MDEIISASLARIAFTMTLLIIAALVALILGLVGLYGVISYIVGQRTSEIGLMVLRQGLGVAVVGVVVGLGVAAAATRVMGSLLFEVSTHDPVTFGAAALALTAVSALATYLPARRVARIDPVVALRSEL